MLRSDKSIFKIKIWGIFDTGAACCDITDNLLDDPSFYGEIIHAAIRFGGYENIMSTCFFHTPTEKALYKNTYFLIGQARLLNRISFQWSGKECTNNAGEMNLLSVKKEDKDELFIPIEEDLSTFKKVGNMQNYDRNTNNE